MAIVYDGDQEISMKESDILHLDVLTAIRYYKMTEIYYSVVKKEYEITLGHAYLMLRDVIKEGRDLLFKRLEDEIGTDRAALVAADILLKIRLTDD